MYQAPPKGIFYLFIFFCIIFIHPNFKKFERGLQNASLIFPIFFKILKGAPHIFCMYSKVVKLPLHL